MVHAQRPAARPLDEPGVRDRAPGRPRRHPGAEPGHQAGRQDDVVVEPAAAVGVCPVHGLRQLGPERGESADAAGGGGPAVVRAGGAPVGGPRGPLPCLVGVGAEVPHVRADPAGPVPGDETVPYLPTYRRTEVEHLGQGGQLTQCPVVGGVEEAVQPDRLPHDDVLAEDGEAGGVGAHRLVQVGEERHPAVPEDGEQGGSAAGFRRAELAGRGGESVDTEGQFAVVRCAGVP